MRADDIAFVSGHQQAVEPLFHEHIEVVEPEVSHHFFKLSLAVDGAQKFRLHQFAHYHDRRIVHCEQSFFLLRTQAFEKLMPFASTQNAGEEDLLLDRHAENFFEALLRRKVRQLLDFEVGIELLLAAARLLLFLAL